MGVLTGPSWPGRWMVRGVGSFEVASGVRLEGRAGLNLVTKRPLEPGIEVMAVFQPEF